MKNHQGNEQWLELFSLVSAEFAEAESCPIPLDGSQKSERISKIQSLEKQLDAVSTLEQIRHGVRGTDLPLAQGFRPSHLLIRFDHKTKTVSVEPYNAPIEATQSYDNAESADNENESTTQTIVLVEVDKIQDLKKAYPNYFGDVEFFSQQLKKIVKDGTALEYTTAIKQNPKPPREKYGDLSWLRNSRYPNTPSLRKKRNRYTE